MARVIAIVTELSGKFFAKDAKGNIVELQKGDEIFEGMIVYGDSANGASDTINIHAYSGEEITLASNQEQLFDVTMVDAELVDLDSVIAEESIAAIIAENTPQKTQEEEEDDIFEEETAAGDEKAKKDAEVAGDFAAREGNMADVNSDLRDARFKVQSRTFEVKSQFEREDDGGIEAIQNRFGDTFVTMPRPTPITNPVPSPNITPEPNPNPNPNPNPLPIPEPTPITSAVTTTIKDAKVFVKIEAIDNEANESENLTYKVSIVNVNGDEVKVPTGKEIKVNLSYEGSSSNSATDGEDYDSSSVQTITISGGSSSTEFDVPTKDDYYAEGDEGLKITIDSIDNTSSAFDDIDLHATANDAPSDAITVIGTIKDNPAQDTVNSKTPSETGGYEDDDTVYVKIIDDASVVEGEDLVHHVQLVDKDGNAVVIPDGETLTVTLEYSNDTTEDGDYSNTREVTVTLDKNTQTDGNGIYKLPITNETIDDFMANENSDNSNESYKLSITNVAQSNNSFENVAIDLAHNSVTGKILDGVTLGTPENANVDEDTFVATDVNSKLQVTHSLNITAPNGDNEYTLLFDPSVGVKDPDTNGDISLTSNGNTITFDYTTQGKITATREGDGKKVFEITLNKNNVGGGDDSYTYTQYENIDHPDVDSDDDIVLTFGYKIADQGQTSSVQNFTVTVNDSLPEANNQDINVNEDAPHVIVISNESFLNGEITLNNGVDASTSVANGGSIDIYDTDKNDIVGTLTNNGDGTLTFTPHDDYSGATAGFSYSGASDMDGDSASANVSISVVPKSDAPTIATGSAVTNEDTAVTINLRAPLVKDYTDKNEAGGTTAGDYPEKLGLVSLYNMANGVELQDQNGTHLWTSGGTGSKLYILLSDGAHTKDTIDSFTADANHITMTTAEFEALKVNPIAQSHRDIDIKMDVISYEVDANGNRLDSADTVGTNGSKTTQTFHVEVNAVTDAIILEFDTATNGSISQTIRVNDTFTHNSLNEGDNTIDLKAILSATAGGIVDLDQSENMSYKFEGIPEGTLITLGSHTATANASGEAIIWFWEYDYIADPQLSMKLPEQYSGQVNATLTLTAKDIDNDSSVTTETKTQVLYFNVDVAPIADIATLQVAQAFGQEDAGRSGGNTATMSDTIDQPANGIALDIKVSSDDKDGSETFTVRISDIPNDAKIYYDGVEQNINSGEIIISNFDNDAPLYFIPPHNSDSDYTLKVNAKTVDGTSEWNDTWLTVTDKDMKVVVKDVADVPVGTELNDSNGYAYEAVENDLDDNGNSFDLKEVYKTPDDLNSYDSDSETLSIVLSSLPSGFGVEGASLIGNGVWTFLADNIGGVKITTPANFSGEASFDLKYVTTEDAGDSKTHHTDTVKIFVNPSAEAEVATATTANEDVLQKVDFGISHQNGDTDETLEEIRIKVDDVEGKEFTLYLGSDGNTALADAGLTVDNGYYVLNATQADNVYAKNTTEHTHGSYDFEVGYTVKDSEANQNTDDTKDGTITYDLTINAVTDAPTAAIETISGGAGYSVNGTTVTVNTEDTIFSIPVKVTSDDTDASEDVTQYLISGVPMGVEVVGASYYGYTGSIHNGIWLLDIADTAISNANGYTQNIEFKVNQGADFANRDIKITAYTQDEGASVENDSVTFTLEKNYTVSGPGTGTPPEFVLGAKPATIYEDDSSYNLSESLTVSKNGGNLSGNYAITITDLPAGSSVAGHSYAYEEGGMMRYVITGNGNAADAMAKLSSVTITPPANINDSDNSTQSMSFIATIATHHNGTFHQGNTINYSESILPVTDEMTIAVNANDTDEDTDVNFSVVLSNDADGINTELIGGKLYIKYSEQYEGGEAAQGELWYSGTKLTTTEILGGNTYFVVDINSYTLGNAINFTFKPGEDRHGEVSFDVLVQNKEGHTWGATDHHAVNPFDTTIQNSTASKTITVSPIIDGFDQSGINDSIGNEATGGADNRIKIDMGAVLSDPSESIGSATLDKIPNGFLIFYGNDVNSLSLATNAGNSLTYTGDFVVDPAGAATAVKYNQWLLPLSGGKLPNEIWIQAPQNWSGTLDDAVLNLFGITDGTNIDNTDYTFDVTFSGVADGLTIDPTLTFGDAFDWVDLKLNANMEDVDGSEKMNLEISGLDAMAQFRLSDGSDVDATFANNTWTLQNVSYDQINNIQLLHDTSVDNVGLKAWTVESVNGDASSLEIGSFTLTLSNVTGELTLPSGAGLDFDKVDALSSLSAIDTINLGAQGANSLQNLTLADVVAITSNSNELVIDGDSADSVTFADSNEWTKGNSVDGYTTYTGTDGGNSVTLKINDDINQPIA
jgi:hypothetical protein